MARSRRSGGLRAAVEPTSFEAWFPRLLPFAHNVGYRFFANDQALAADVAQEALTRAFVAWQRIHDHPNLEAWVTTTALRVALEMCRQQHRLERPTTVRGEIPSDEQRVVDGHALARALSRLSKRQRQVVVWRYYFDSDVEETARRLGLSESQVKDATHEARKKLVRLLCGEDARA